MLTKEIKTKLNNINITEFTTKQNKGIITLTIEGEVWIYQIKQLFNVINWEYNKGKAVFYIKA
jgi:hypothetical protein